MADFNERENRRRVSAVGRFFDSVPADSGDGRGRPKENRELKKRVSLSVMPSLYEDIQKIAYVQRRSVSDLVCGLLAQYREQHEDALEEYCRLKNCEQREQG